MAFLKNEEIIALFNARFACKKFDGEKTVSDLDFNTILEAGRLSPSSFGFEPWHFLVLEKKTDRQKTLREKLKECVWGGRHALENASHFVLVLARKKEDLDPQNAYLKNLMQNVHQMDEETAAARSAYFSNFAFNEWGFLKEEKSAFAWACRQCYIALGNMMTTAAALGVDSCAVEGFQPEKTNALLIEEKIIDLAHFGVAVMLGVGYRAENPKRAKTRSPFKEVVEFL